MRLPDLTPRGWLVVSVGVLAALALALWLLTAPGRHRHATATARVETALIRSHTASAAAAVEVITAGASRDAAGDKLSQETADGIRATPGADQRLDPRLNRAGLVGLCKRSAYRGRPECLQYLGPEQLPPARPGR